MHHVLTIKLVTVVLVFGALSLVISGCQLSPGKKPVPEFKRTSKDYALSFPATPTKSGDISFQILSASVTEVSTIISRQWWNGNFEVQVSNNSSAPLLLSKINSSIESQPAPCSGGRPHSPQGDWKVSSTGVEELPTGKTGKFSMGTTCSSGDLFSQPFHMKVNTAVIPLAKK